MQSRQRSRRRPQAPECFRFDVQQNSFETHPSPGLGASRLICFSCQRPSCQFRPAKKRYSNDTLRYSGSTMATRHLLDGRRQGLPLVFVHADPGRATQWEAVMTSMSKTHDVVAFDFRGSGASVPPTDGDYSHAGRAADIAAVGDEELPHPHLPQHRVDQ